MDEFHQVIAEIELNPGVPLDIRNHFVIARDPHAVVTEVGKRYAREDTPRFILRPIGIPPTETRSLAC